MAVMARITRFDDAAGLARGAAECFADLAEAAVAKRGRFTAALSGGSTPKALYTLLSGNPYAKRIDWARTFLFFGDERCVPPDHPKSNYRMVKETLLDRTPLPESNVFRMRGEAPPGEAAAEYEALLVRFFCGAAEAKEGPPRFDLVLLGLGNDGHTASLFPGTAALAEKKRLVAAQHVAKLGAFRITFTLPLINAARQVLFLVSGEGKAERLKEVLQGPFRPDVLPAQAAAPPSGRLDWFVDRAAASLLP